MIDITRIKSQNDALFTDRIGELRSEHTRLLDEADAIASKHPVLNAGQKQRVDNLIAGAQRVRADLDQAVAERDARLDECIKIAESAEHPGRLEPAVGPRHGEQDWQPMRRTGDPWAPGAEQRFGGPHAQRDRALAAVARSTAPDVAKQRATALLDAHPDDAASAGWARTASNPVYRKAFEKVIRNPEAGPLLLDDDERRAFGEAQEARAALAITSGTGGLLMPFELDPTVVIGNAGVTSPIRQIARTEVISTMTWHGVSSAGVQAEWLSEAAEASDNTPSFSQPIVHTHKASAYVEASIEFSQDTTGGEQLSGLFADARDRLEAEAHVNGTGSGQPYGILTRVSAVTTSRVSATTNNLYGSPDVYRLIDSLPPRYRPNASWIGSLSILNRTRQFDTSGGSSFWANLGADTPEQLLGRNVYEVSSMVGSLGTGDDDVLMIGDFSNYLIADRLGMAIQYDPMVRGSNRRPIGAVSWWAYWRTGADCLNTDAFRLLRV